MFKLTVVDHLRPCEHYCTRWRTTKAPFESLGKKFRKTYLSNKSQSLNQVEGGWDEDGKGLSNWDKWTEDPSHTTDGSSGKVFFFSSKKSISNGKVSADSYHKYKEDVQLAADMGVGVYRVSVAWSRIVPEGLGAVSPEVGLQKIP